MAEIPKQEHILATTSACPGCSSSLSLRYILKAAGPDTVLVIPASCTSVIQGMYPHTAVQVPVYNIAFAAAASCASGMSSALRRAGRDTKVIVYAGDGGTVDIGLQALSGALERETDFLYICFDNEAYGNTGMQRSGSTPLGALTTTTPAGKVHPKKEIDRIVEAHHLPYQATAISAFPVDLYRKVEKALTFRGPSFIHLLGPCPTGWRFPHGKTIEVGRMAVKTTAWILWERIHGVLSVSSPSKGPLKNPIPLQDYLGMQGRFRITPPSLLERLQGEIDTSRQEILKEVEGT